MVIGEGDGMIAVADGTGMNVADVLCATMTTMTIVQDAAAVFSCAVAIHSFVWSVAVRSPRKPASMRPCGCSIGCSHSLVQPHLPHRSDKARSVVDASTTDHHLLVFTDAVAPDDYVAKAVSFAACFVVAVTVTPATATIPISIPISVAPVSFAVRPPILPVTALIPIPVHPGLSGHSSSESTGENASCNHNR